MVYPVSGDPLVPSPHLPALENAIQEFWRTDDTFRASIAQREGAEEFVFYDVPPSPTACPTTATCSPASSRTSSRASAPWTA